jgi:Flp pilus assembly protein TadD
LLHSQEYVDFRAALDEFEYARRLFSEGRLDDALFSAEVARSLAPDVGGLHRLLGDIERELDHDDRASQHYRRYLELVPGRHRDQERVRGILEELAG